MQEPESPEARYRSRPPGAASAKPTAPQPAAPLAPRARWAAAAAAGEARKRREADARAGGHLALHEARRARALGTPAAAGGAEEAAVPGPPLSAAGLPLPGTQLREPSAWQRVIELTPRGCRRAHARLNAASLPAAIPAAAGGTWPSAAATLPKHLRSSNPTRGRQRATQSAGPNL